jgi:hypothetical protein
VAGHLSLYPSCQKAPQCGAFLFLVDDVWRHRIEHIDGGLDAINHGRTRSIGNRQQSASRQNKYAQHERNNQLQKIHGLNPKTGQHSIQIDPEESTSGHHADVDLSQKCTDIKFESSFYQARSGVIAARFLHDIANIHKLTINGGEILESPLSKQSSQGIPEKFTDH